MKRSTNEEQPTAHIARLEAAPDVSTLGNIHQAASPDKLVALRHHADEIEARLLAAAQPTDQVN